MSQELKKCIAGTKTEIIKLENGADAFFLYPTHVEGKRPMVVLLHGGPFSASPYQMFLINRLFLLA
jgi:poly(3-hydroxybutyrate) depolymerase